MKKEKTTQFLMKPKVDFCFKELMQDEEVRNAFLAAVLGINLEEIVESRILPSHLRQKDKDDKLGILDVRVLLNNKEQIDIEIQVTSSEYWVERTLFYLGKMFVDQLKPGEDYQKLEKCIHVGILNFTLFDDEEYYPAFISGRIREERCIVISMKSIRWNFPSWQNMSIRRQSC